MLMRTTAMNPITARAAKVSVLLVLCVFAQEARTQTFWAADPSQPGDWYSAGNWSNGTPTSSVNAFIDNGGTAVIESGNASSGYLYVANKGTGVLQQNGGYLQTTEHTYLGVAAGSSGRFIFNGVTGKDYYSTHGCIIGHYGTGEFIHTGGKTYAIDMYIANKAGSYGSYEMSGAAELECYDELYVGWAGEGHFRQTGGWNHPWGGVALAQERSGEA
jgi:hypothetical protein